MSGQMLRLGRMVDEALSEADAMPAVANAPRTGYWDENDHRARYNAVSDACWIYQCRELEQNLRHFGWRKARGRVLGQGALSRQWMNRRRGDLRLTRGGLEMRFTSGPQTIGWKKLKDMIEARRS